MNKQKHNNELTLKDVYKRLRDCLNAVEPSNKRISGAMRDRLGYNIEFLRLFIQLQNDSYTDVQAIGFEVESERDYEDNSDE